MEHLQSIMDNIDYIIDNGSDFFYEDDKELLLKQAKNSFSFLTDYGFINGLTDYPPINRFEDFRRLIDLEHLIKIVNMDFTDAYEYMQKNIRTNGHGPTLTTVLTDKCTKACVHCSVDSTSKGLTLPFKLLENANEQIIGQFDRIFFGREGEALQTFSKDEAGRYFFGDYFKVLLEKGARTFSLDTKGIRNHEKKIMEQYLKVRDLVKSYPDSNFTQRISFNLFSPDVVLETDEDKKLRILEEELIPVLSVALDFANTITINSSVTQNYSEANLISTSDPLKTIMTANGYVPIYLSELTHNDETEFNPVVYFLDPKTQKRIRFRVGLTLNQGRWVSNKDNLTPQDNILGNPHKRRSTICHGLLLNSMHLRPDGNIHICGGNWESYTNLGPINQSLDNYMSSLEMIHNQRVKYVSENLDFIVEGRDKQFMCNYSGKTNPPRGEALPLLESVTNAMFGGGRGRRLKL